MDTKGFFDFYNTIYTYDKGKTVINALRNRKMTFNHWAEGMLRSVRIAKRVFLLARSNRFSVEYDIKKNPRKFLEQKYHEVRKRQIELILEYIEKVKIPENQRFILHPSPLLC